MSQMGAGSGDQNPVEQIKELQRQFDFKTIKDGKVGDHDAYVLEGEIKADAETKKKQPNAKSATIYVDKQDYFVRKTDVNDEAKKSIMMVELSNMKANVKLDEAIFKYTPPPDVQVMDMEMLIKMQQGAAE
jgi:outer membrane lipoprotein-sorting protein